MPIQIRVSSENETDKPFDATLSYQKKEIVLGRLPSSDVVLDQAEIGSRHAIIRVDQQPESDRPKLFITDLGSSEGTLLGEEKLQAFREVELQVDKPLVIGKYKLQPTVIGDEVSLEDVSETKQTTDKPKQEGVSKPVINLETVHPEASGTMSTTNIVDLDFDASRLVALSGRVIHRGKPLAGVRIDAGELGSFISDEEGKFRTTEKPEETSYRVQASKDGYTFDQIVQEGTLENQSELVFNAKQLLTISGCVRHKGKPFARVDIDAGGFGKTVTDDNGMYCINNVPEGSDFKIIARRDGYVFSQKASA